MCYRDAITTMEAVTFHSPPVPTNRSLPRMANNRRHAHIRKLLFAALVATVVLMRTVGASDKVTVKVLNLMYNMKADVEIVNSLNAGLSASLATNSVEKASDFEISLQTPSSYNQTIEETFNDAVKNSKEQLLVIVGPLGNQNVLWIRDKLEEHDLVAFAPLSYSDEVRGWNPHFYYPSVEPKAELLALIRYAVVFLRLRRVGFMYLKGTNFGDSSYTFTEQMMSMMGYKLCGTFAIDGNVNERIGDDVFDKEWEKFVKTRPQAVLLFGSPHDITKKFIQYLVREDYTADAFVLTTSSSQTFLLNTWKEALEETNTELKPGQLIITGTGPLASDTRYKIIQRFREEMTKYLNTNENWGGFAKPEHFDTNHNSGELMVLGWLAGEMLMRALVDSISLTNRTLFRLSLYNQRRYLIDDMVIGDFGGECGSAAQLQGAVCRCNQGGSVVYMKEVVEKYQFASLRRGFFLQKGSECGTLSVPLYAPMSSSIIMMADMENAHRANLRYYRGIFATFLRIFGEGRDRLYLHSLNSSYSGAAKDLSDTLDERIVSAVFGVLTNEVLTTPDVIFFDPMVVFPQVSTFKRNVIHFFPTLTQELYVLAQYFSCLQNHIAHTIIRSDEAAEVAEVLSMSLMTFGASLGSRVLLNEHVSDIHMEHLKHGGDVFILGLTTPDVKTISKYLDTHPQARVFITFTDLLLYYEELKLEFSVTANAKAQRLVFVTSLPHWADNSSTSETIIAYHEAIPDPSQWSPMSLRGFAIARVMQTLLLPMKKVSSSLLSDEIFWQTSFVVDDMRYGPFSDSDCIANGVQLSGNCVWNYGATDISVWSFGRVLDPTLPVMQEPVTPSIVYKKIRVQLSSSQVVGIIIGLVFALLLFVTLGVALYCTISNKRDNELAPRQSTDPVTLIFTDIESSTAQWATYPDIMTEAVAAHHRMIRQLVLKHDCYEVKTIGDSFMIACQDPFKAVQLAADLQLMFLHNDWGTDALDNFYREFEEANAKEDNEYTSTACLDSEVYCRLWSGLRVRIGIHTGLCDIRHDEVTKGFDYYGPTTNMAARTESVANGGQVLLTHATYMSLSESQRHQLDVTALGPVQLRGVPQPVQLYQLNAVPGRTFAALRLDHDYYFEDGNETTNSTSENSSSRVELSESAQMIMSSLQMLLATFKGQQREKLLMPYCERWRVPLPRTNTEEWNDEYCREVIHRIAAKVGRVADHYAGTHSNHSISTLSSTSVVIISDNKILLDED